jgi:hypothetical protein
MNKKETTEAIEVMQAFVDGAEMQWYGGLTGKWRDFDDNDPPQWIWGHEQYRIKPKPREWNMMAMGDGLLRRLSERDVGYSGQKVKVREVND